jgi:CheY-like chemotaxis protein
MTADHATPPQPAPAADRPDEVRILLVDDRPENLVALEAILGSLDHELVRAGSGEEALKALLTHEFAVILLDASMPGMDGFETATRIKRREKTRDIPIIFLTALNNDQQHAFRGYEVGAVDYLTKPFDPWVLRAKVSVFVDLYQKNRQLREQADLLRRELGTADQRTGPSTVDPVATAATVDTPGTVDTAAMVAGLSAGLAAVAAQVDVVATLVADAPAHPAGPAVAELSQQVAALRSSLDALVTAPAIGE